MKDATLREVYIETADPTELFPKLLSVCYGSSYRVCESISFFQSILIELWNRELYEQLICKFDKDLSINRTNSSEFESRVINYKSRNQLLYQVVNAIPNQIMLIIDHSTFKF
jgi:hypothetical protein